MKETIKRLLGRFGYTISRAPTLGSFLKSRNIDIVFDVGANVGQFAKSIRDEGYAGEIVSFEPVSSAFEALRSNMADDKNWSGNQAALGDSRREGIINVSDLTVFSSIQPQTAYAAKHSTVSRVVRDEKIQIFPLDELYSSKIVGRRPFLKVDTQGFEEAVIQGSVKSLPHILGVSLELPVEHLYQNAWKMADAISRMDELGFLPAQMRPSCVVDTDPQSWLEIDCIFRRKTE
jgi:FkbM family methyltransferase